MKTMCSIENHGARHSTEILTYGTVCFELLIFLSRSA